MPNATVEHQLRVTKIVWVIFLVSQASFLTALFIARKEIFSFDAGKSFLSESPVVPVIFAFLAMVNLALSFFIKSLAVKKAVEEQNLKLVQTAVILALSFCEAVGIMGLILALAFNYQYFFLWSALGILGIVLHYPRRADFIAASQKQS